MLKLCPVSYVSSLNAVYGFSGPSIPAVNRLGCSFIGIRRDLEDYDIIDGYNSSWLDSRCLNFHITEKD